MSGFFFQAKDGIRDTSVTGVQTCALPISRWATWSRCCSACRRARRRQAEQHLDHVAHLDRRAEKAGQVGRRGGALVTRRFEIGRATCRERVSASVVGGVFEEKRGEVRRWK